MMDITPSDNTEPPNNTASSRALAIPEVLGMTLDFSERLSLARASSVSLMWSDVAVPRLWEELDAVVPLFKLLSPMTFQSADDTNGDFPDAWGYDTYAADFRWDRFSHYARHVKKIKATESNDTEPKQNSTIKKSAWISILTTQPHATVLLPNLKLLVFTFSDRHDLHSILPLIPPGLRDLGFSFLNKPPSEAIRQLLQFIRHRTPDLYSLKISYSGPAVDISRSLANWITGTPKLGRIVLPQFHHTKDIVAALAKLQHLEAIKTDFRTHQPYRDDGIQLKMESHDFPKLRTIEVEVAPANAPQLFRATPQWGALTGVSIVWQQRYERENFALFAEAFRAVCVNATHLCLILFTKHEDSAFKMDFEDIRPLLGCSLLQSFKLVYDFAFALEAKDIEELGRAWPMLERLLLSSDPYVETAAPEDGTTIQVLPLLATHVPKLEYLGLFFNKLVRPEFNGNLHPPVQFSNLRTLDVGTSDVPGGDLAEVGFFLGSLCNRELEIIHGISDAHLADHGVGQAAVGALWDIVEGIVAKAVFCKPGRRRDA